jgi:hypothetical protein
MTKIDGHKHYDQKIGHGQFGQATSDPTWPILCGRIVTKPNGRNSNLAQSNCVALDGPSPVTRPFFGQTFFYESLFHSFFVWASCFCCLVLLGLGLFAVHLISLVTVHFILGF